MNAFKNGTGALFIDRPRFDESSGVMSAQISVPVIDGDHAIGVLVIGVLADRIARK